MPAFHQLWAVSSAGLDPYPARYDRAAEWLAGTFLHGKFNAIFPFLSGVGSTILMERAEARGRDGLPIYLRRIIALFLYGTIHHLFIGIWEADIPIKDAILGLRIPA